MSPPSVILLISTNCPHCSAMLKSLTALIKKGKISTLKTINIEFDQNLAQQEKVRQVPWMKINEFIFSGKLTESELLHWIEKAPKAEAKALYFSWLIENQGLEPLIFQLKKQPSDFETIINIALDQTTPLAVRVGINAIMEEFENTSVLQQFIPILSQDLAQQPANLRADICYYLGLSHQADAILKPFLNDDNQDVREIVQEALESENK